MGASVLDGIGSTPSSCSSTASSRAWPRSGYKLESANPTGSYKDRMALAMIDGGARTGRLAPSQTVVEYTGASLAFVCAVNGYSLGIVSSDVFRGRAARGEGLRSRPSTGANLTVAVDLAPELGPGRRVVTPLVDSGLEDLAGDLYA